MTVKLGADTSSMAARKAGTIASVENGPPYRIGVVTAALPGGVVPLEYLILHVNRVQRHFEFELISRAIDTEPLVALLRQRHRPLAHEELNGPCENSKHPAPSSSAN